MTRHFDLTHLLNEDIDYSALPYGLKIFLRSIGFDIYIDPTNPYGVDFVSESAHVDYSFDVTETSFGLTIDYIPFD